MKLKYGIIALVAAALAFVGCTPESDHFLSQIKVSTSYISLPAEGGQATLTLTAVDEWTFVKVYKVNDEEVIAPEWLTVAPQAGAAGDATVTFSAEAATETREASLTILCAGKTQTINVIQMTEKQELAVTSIADVIAAGAGSFRIKGMITKVANTQ